MKRVHTWAIEEVSGGPAGTDDVYRCTVCGCCGGGTEHSYFDNGALVFMNRSPKPFLPGAAVDLSEDCDEALMQIDFFVRGYMMASVRPLTSMAARLLLAADKYTTREHPRVEFLQKVMEVGQGREVPMDELRKQLIGMGFRILPPKCVQCGEPNDRPADDHTEKCYQCVYADERGTRGGFLS